MTVLTQVGETSAWKVKGSMAPKPTQPISPVSAWTDIHLDPTAVAAQPLNPASEAASNSNVRRFQTANGGTAVLLRCKYTGTPSVFPTVIVHGYDGGHKREPGTYGVPLSDGSLSAIPMILPDVDGNESVALTGNPATNVKDEAGNIYGPFVRIDVMGSEEITLAVTVAAAGATTIAIQAKLI